MNTTKSKLYLSAIVLAFSAIFISCKKSDSPDIPQSLGPIITAIGTPTGDITNALIDPSGGTLNSADGKLTITIPAGALSSATNISIQTITNMAPLGMGFGYRLQPEGTTFSIPVQLTFHYDNQLLQQTPEDFLWIVTQAADRSWNALLQSALDTNANTVTVTTTHFSDWVLGRFMDFTMTPSSSTVQKGNSIQLKVTAFSVALGDVPDLAPLIPLSLLGNDIDLTPLTPFGMEWDYFRIKEWTMNGVVAPVSNSHGSLNAFVSGAIYIAPNQIPANNPVAVSVQLDCRNTLGGSKTYFLTSNITVIGDEEYLLVRIDGQQYNYLNDGSTGFFCQLSLSGQLQIIAEMGQGGTQYNVFGLGFDNPSVTTMILNGPTGDNSNLVFFPDAFLSYTMNYEQRTIEADSSCTRIDRYGSATATLTEYSGPGTITRGFFSGTLYEDNSLLSSNCNMPIAHSIEGEFVLMVAP